MKTKPFNLEEALNGAKVVTRDGREVTQLTCFDTSDNYEYSLYGVIGKDICCWARTGQVNIDTNIHCNDLFLAVEPQRIWVNAYNHNGKLWLGGAQYDSLTEAKVNAVNSTNMQYIKTIEITDEL
jgi:galactose mutarotase-like enzyme